MEIIIGIVITIPLYIINWYVARKTTKANKVLLEENIELKKRLDDLELKCQSLGFHKVSWDGLTSVANNITILAQTLGYKYVPASTTPAKFVKVKK